MFVTEPQDLLSVAHIPTSTNSYMSRRSSAGMATMLGAGRCGVRIPLGSNRFFSPPKTSRPARLPPLPGIKRPGRGFNHSIPSLVPGSGTSGAVPLLLLYGSMAWTGKTLQTHVWKLFILNVSFMVVVCLYPQHRQRAC